MTAVPAPPSVERTASQLLTQIHLRGGRTFRLGEPPQVICLTDDAELASWLQERGARPHIARVVPHYPLAEGKDVQARMAQYGSYRRAHDSEKLEWDFLIHTIPVAGEQTVWEAAAR